MSRIIVIGNSHVAALKHAWNALPDDERRHDLRFFAAHGPHFRKLSLDSTLRFGLTRRRAVRDPDAAKRVYEINGAQGIRLSRADAVVWAGFLWPMTPLAQLMAQFDIDDLREVGAARRLSRAAFDAICTDFAAALVPGERWRNWSGTKLILHMRPLPVETCVNSRNPVYDPWRPILRDPAGSMRVLDAFLDHFEAMVAPFGMEILRQSPETQTPSGLTKAEYARGLLAGRVEYNHMNAAYGAFSLRAIMARADALTDADADAGQFASLAAGAARG